MNRKVILLAGAAVILAGAAHAEEVNPYIGLDYVYSHADFKSDNNAWDKSLKKDYNSGAVNLGMRPSQYFSLEGFFQQSASEKGSRISSTDNNRVKSKFYGYGADAYGYMPIGCDGFSLLGTVGLANYNFKVKTNNGSTDKDHLGYRGGLGFQYDMDDHWALRVVGRYTYIDSRVLDNLMEATAGIRYTF